MYTNSSLQNDKRDMCGCKSNKHLSFDKNSKQNSLESSLPIQLDHVDQYYYELMKLYSTSKNCGENSKTSDFYRQKPLTTTFISSSNYSAEFQNSNMLCCFCCSEHDIGNHDKNIVDYLSSCCHSQKLQRIIHHLILILLGISIVLSIILSLLGIFLNYRACLTAGCILGIASFGALLHSCLRHRALPNSSMPIILGQSYMHPIVNNMPLSMNKLYRKHQQFPQRHRQLLNYDYSKKDLIKHSYFAPRDGYYTDNQDYNNFKNNHGKNIPIISKRNPDKLCHTYQLQTTTDVEYNHSGNKRNIECSSDSSSLPSITLSVTTVSGDVVATTSVAITTPTTTKNTVTSSQKRYDDNNSNEQNKSLDKNPSKCGDNKSPTFIECEICRPNSSHPTDYEYQRNHMDYAHSNNLVSESMNYVPRSSSPCSSIKASNVQRSQFTYSDSCDLSLSSEIKAESQDQIKHMSPIQQNTLTHIQPNSLNSCDIEADKQFHPYYSGNPLFDGKSNLFSRNEQPKHLNSFMIYPKSKSRNKIILRNYLNLLDGLYRPVNHSQGPNYSSDRFNEEYNNDIFDPRVWLS
ncbi:unnamed protein product [Schistosoma mattheei]|uniref:Serine/threonine-protein kinase DDB_G0282963 n=2 Tax=Schistosoma mattheei TaxID=31246 RepID=A0AA85BE62_9TREM|nr:unnamed protein product [Schistosoma mattheei]